MHHELAYTGFMHNWIQLQYLVHPSSNVFLKLKITHLILLSSANAYCSVLVQWLISVFPYEF